ncbi:MAG: hypothetical protein SGCHY_004625 [Lobulomycetales sp.]
MGRLEEISKLLSSTAPAELDPEAIAQEASGLCASLAAQDDAATQHYLDVGESDLRRRAAAPDLPGKEYLGTRTSRADLYAVDEMQDDNESIQDENESMQDENESIQDENESIQDDKAFSEADSAMDDRHSSGKDEDEGPITPPRSKLDFDNETDRTIDDKLAQLDQEEAKMVQQMSQAAKGSIEKGRNVRNQQRIYDHFLDSRIRIQKLLNIVNRFPIGDSLVPEADGNTMALKTKLSSLPEADGNTNAQELKTNLSSELQALINELVNIRIDLFSQNTHTALPELPAKRSSSDDSDIWTILEQMDTSFRPIQNQILDKWSSKIKSAGGNSGTQLKAVDSKTTTQIANVLADMDRLVKRTQLRRSEYSIIGEEPRDAASEQYNSEIFDDQDFYAMLLKEFVESRQSADGLDPVAMSLSALQIRDLTRGIKKKRAGLDTKASKGRKIRYETHEKLVGFTAPVHNTSESSWHEEMRRELFSGLFADGAVCEPRNEAAKDEGRESARALKIFSC